MFCSALIPGPNHKLFSQRGRTPVAPSLLDTAYVHDRKSASTNCSSPIKMTCWKDLNKLPLSMGQLIIPLIIMGDLPWWPSILKFGMFLCDSCHIFKTLSNAYECFVQSEVWLHWKCLMHQYVFFFLHLELSGTSVLAKRHMILCVINTVANGDTDLHSGPAKHEVIWSNHRPFLFII